MCAYLNAVQVQLHQACAYDKCDVYEYCICTHIFWDYTYAHIKNTISSYLVLIDCFECMICILFSLKSSFHKVPCFSMQHHNCYYNLFCIRYGGINFKLISFCILKIDWKWNLGGYWKFFGYGCAAGNIDYYPKNKPQANHIWNPYSNQVFCFTLWSLNLVQFQPFLWPILKLWAKMKKAHDI